MNRTKNKPNQYPTGSLRQYLAYQSVHQSEQPQPLFQSAPEESPRALLQIQVDVGDGRSQVLTIGPNTDIDAQAQRFCRKFNLNSAVKDLLDQSIRQQFDKQTYNMQRSFAEEAQEEFREIYANTHAREILLSENSSMRKSGQNISIRKSSQKASLRKSSQKASLRKNSQKTNKKQSAQKSIVKDTQCKGANKLLQSYYNKSKRHSLPQDLSQTIDHRLLMNKTSKQIVRRLGKQNIIQLSRQKSRQKLKQIVRQKQQKQLKQLQKCPFKPKINTISKRVIEQLGNKSEYQSDHFQKMYQRHRQIQNKKELSRETSLRKYSFQPQINSISRQIMQSKVRQGSCNQSVQKNILPCSIQVNTYQPKTGRKPLHRNSQNLPIGQYLYNQSRQRKHKVPQAAPQIKASDHSNYLVSILKEKRINEIFTQLTQPPHQLLTLDENSYQILQESPYRYFEPIFNEMLEMGVSLSRQEFMQTALLLLQTLSPQQKYEVILKKDKVASSNVTAAQSLVNSKSREILMLRRNSNDYGDLYSRGLQQKKQAQSRISREKQAKARQQLKNCTFRPAIKRII